jgi:DNA-binding transcriptional LysR family regulator
MMELTDLEVFRAVARLGGVTRAAEALSKVQSGVSARLTGLERELGAELFARKGRSMDLTSRGRAFLDYAERILILAEEARACVRGDIAAGPFRLGAMESTSASRLPELLGRYHSLHPQVALELTTGTTADLIRDVLGYGLDAAFVSEPVSAGGLERLAAFREELVLVAASDQEAITSPAQVATRALLVFRRGCAYRKRLEDWVSAGGAPPGRVVELSSYQTMLGCAASGMGVAIMPRSVADMAPGANGVSIHGLPPDIAQARTSLIWRAGNGTAAVRALAELVGECGCSGQ